jgi:diaminopropionate ammonia-lyase
MSVAAGAKVFGAAAVVVLAEPVPEAFAVRLRSLEAEVVRAGADYEASMEAAAALASDRGWSLLSDSSWPGYTEVPRQVMEGYLAMGVEAADQVDLLGETPTHILLQAGVGGMASSIAAYARHRWGDQPTIVIVEPDRAACLMASIGAGRAERSDGPVSNMGRLDAKEPSLLALASLAVDADFFVTVSDDEAVGTVVLLREHGLTSTPSGAAGVSAIHHAGSLRTDLEVDVDSRVLAFLTEGPETSFRERPTIGS